ncbi:hypothetical protein K488DRAFT_21698, partial [Vararia minispora EC-137]
SLELLSRSTQDKLRSAQILTSLPQVISELVQNALDAHATNVEVGVDCEQWECWVRDNGDGISREGLRALGSGRYHTSKAYSPSSLDQISSFGFRGEAIASAAGVSIIEIASRTSRSRESYTVIVKDSKCLYDGPSTRWRRERPGTVVCLRDIFYNLPVRRRMHPSPSKTLDLIKREIETFALVFPTVSFSLQDIARVKGGLDGSVMTIKKARDFSPFYLSDHSKAHPIAPCNLHRVIETIFSRSTYGRTTSDRLRRSQRKPERRPVFVLDLTLPSQTVDRCVDPAKTAVHLMNNNAVITFLQSVVRSFLVRHGFLFLDAYGSSEPPSYPRKRRKVETAPPCNVSSLHNRIDGCAFVQEEDQDTNNEPIIWCDPRTGARYHIDRRTGNSYREDVARRRAEGREEEDRRPGTLQRRTLHPDSRASLGRDEDTPEWIINALQANTAYKLLGCPIPSALPPSQTQTHTHACFATHHHPTGVHSMTFDRVALADAVVLAQVDRKFILCTLDDGVLAVFDQHAASERVRVERFLRELCELFLEDGQREGAKAEVTPAMPVLVTRREKEMLRVGNDVREVLERWGFSFVETGEDSAEEGEEGLGAQVYVRSVPSVVSQKLLAPNELQTFLKDFLAEREAGDSTPPIASQVDNAGTDDAFSWQRALRFCPRGLIELANTRACRAGAIMFNDALTRAQCERLVSQLAQTAFPFQCAHGRPSLMPLA